MGHGTPYNMYWAGLLQNLLVMLQIRQIMSGSIQFSVKEELEPGTLVGSLRNHFSPPFQLLTNEYLWMDEKTGNFYISEQKMDREYLCPGKTKADECIIVHTAVVGPSGELVQFSVTVEDINDNAPRFENSKIHLNISEDIPIGTSLVLDDQAQDRDSGPNGQLMYKLKGSGGVFTLKVEEDGQIILLIVRMALDRESLDLYQMQLVATDCGEQPLSASVSIIVTVTDVNDNCPSFHPDSPHSATITGGSKKNTVVTQVVATDLDVGPNAAIVYSLSPKVSERAKKLLFLNSHSGHIRLMQDLERDSSEELVLKVLASGLHCPPAETQVTISLLPKATQGLTIKIGFIAEHYNQTILLPESHPPTALAVLELEGDSSFKDSSLAIEGDVPFFLSPQSGKYVLYTSKPLDYEMKSEYHISVVVQGSSSERSVIALPQREIRVIVEDVNDNAPHFSQCHYQLEVQENNKAGLTLLQLSASDADSGLNGRVTYRLDKHVSAIFKVDSVTGQLSALVPLDREQNSTYKVIVFARDGGFPSLESQASVIIHVLDQNDNAPVFYTPHFIFFVPENAPPFALVGKIEVEDPDEGENGNLELQVVKNSAPFAVDSMQRTLQTTANLDHEMTDHHELFLVVSDNGHPVALTSTARVTVFVEDINDNEPKVILPSSNFSCLAVSPGTSVAHAVIVGSVHCLGVVERQNVSCEIDIRGPRAREAHIISGPAAVKSTTPERFLPDMGCYDCCMRCLAGVPYCSLVATLLCFSGISLFCGCGHQALTEMERLIEDYFARNRQDYNTLAYIIQYFQYAIYGLASFFFLYCIALLAEGFYTTSAAKQTFGEFRSTMCGRCLSSSFIVMTYVLAVLWLLVFAFSALPVYFFYNMGATCRTIDLLTETPASINQLCVDARQYGLLPWSAVPGKACGMTLSNVCKTREYWKTYNLYIAAFAGAGITLLALLTYTVSSTYNFAVLRYLGRKGIGPRC
ncbi:hypothetical protein ATANTOWER_008247 [Ataeniobius toweri]|uniref:Cadherin domain-containing protein n=1 Tax=Ataeniobius toweri TaxID=208326 RepID=A0ABU7CEB8_9TELE|nr:hypothetical protein [Ataeniobius toweri]